jgi:hypothetical protein
MLRLITSIAADRKTMVNRSELKDEFFLKSGYVPPNNSRAGYDKSITPFIISEGRRGRSR